MKETIRLIRERGNRPSLNTALSHALLRRASVGLEPETLRLYRPKRVVAFGPLDRLAPGYADAVAAAEARGFASVQRLSGGRAAVFHEHTIAFAWIVPDPDPRLRIRERFEELAGIMAAAFRSLGVDARIGEVPGEYCPGEHSVNARGRTKLMGVGQRVVARAAHVGGVAVVGGSGLIRDVLVPVYQHLGLSWDPATAGSLEDEVGPMAWADAERAVLAEFERRYRLAEADGFSEETVALAAELEERHTPVVEARPVAAR